MTDLVESMSLCSHIRELIERRRQAGRRRGGNLRQPVQIIVLCVRRHPQRAVLFENFTALKSYI